MGSKGPVKMPHGKVAVPSHLQDQTNAQRFRSHLRIEDLARLVEEEKEIQGRDRAKSLKTNISMVTWRKSWRRFHPVAYSLTETFLKVSRDYQSIEEV